MTVRKKVMTYKTRLYNNAEKFSLKIFLFIVEAVKFSGTDSLKNMRDTVERHVRFSKSTMFEQAKDEMLAQMKGLKVCHIL